MRSHAGKSGVRNESLPFFAENALHFRREQKYPFKIVKENSYLRSDLPNAALRDGWGKKFTKRSIESFDAKKRRISMEIEPEMIELAACAAHEANRILCLAQGDTSQPLWANSPDWQKESAISGVKAIVSGEVKEPQDAHESWLRQKEADGWIYGEEKDPEKRTHPCMVPYSQLPVAQQAKDEMFLLVVQSTLALGIWEKVPQ